MRRPRMPGTDPGELADRHLAALVTGGTGPSLAWAVIRDRHLDLGGFGGASAPPSPAGQNRLGCAAVVIASGRKKTAACAASAPCSRLPSRILAASALQAGAPAGRSPCRCCNSAT